MNSGWLVPIIFFGLCVLSLLWSSATAPGLNVRDKHVLISGGTKGVGLAIAKKYAQDGAKLTLVGRSTDRLEHARTAIQEHLGKERSSHPIFLSKCDVSDVEQVKATIAQANAFHERVTDHVVHAAVVVTPGFAWAQDMDKLRKDHGATYFGAVNLFWSAAPAMVKSGVKGNFVIVAPAAAAFTNAIGSSAFSGPLAGLRAVAEALRNELLPQQIAVSMFYPGAVSSGSGLSHVTTKPKTTVVKEPKTPGGSDEVTTEFVAMEDELTAAATSDLDAEAKSYFDALRMGFFLNTNSWSGFCYRAANTGIAPRKVLLFEFLLLFFLTPYFEISRMLSDRRILRAGPIASKPVTYATFETSS